MLGFISPTHLNSVSKKSRDTLRSSYPAPTWRGSQQIFQVNKYFLQSRYREDTQEAGADAACKCRPPGTCIEEAVSARVLQALPPDAAASLGFQDNKGKSKDESGSWTVQNCYWFHYPLWHDNSWSCQASCQVARSSCNKGLQKFKPAPHHTTP